MSCTARSEVRRPLRVLYAPRQHCCPGSCVPAGDEDDLVSIDSQSDDAIRPVDMSHVVMGASRGRGEPPSCVPLDFCAWCTGIVSLANRLGPLLAE